jgi:hypothetical protein
MVAFLATCFIHSSFGWTVIPAILAEKLSTQSTTDLAERGSLDVRERQPSLQLVGLQDPVFSSQIFIPQQQLLVHRPPSKRATSMSLPSPCPADLRWAPLIAQKTYSTHGKATPIWDNCPRFLPFQLFGHTGSEFGIRARK